MTLYSIVLGATIAANLWLIGFALLRLNRRLPQLALVSFLGAFSVSHGSTIVSLEGGGSAAWDGLGFAALVLGHAALALFAIAFLYAESLRRRLPTVAGVFVPGIVIAALGAYAGRSPSQVFQPATDVVNMTVNGYLVACLAVALAESLAVWRRSPSRSREVFPLVVGSIALVIAGPIYGFELVALRFTGLAGTNLGVPFAGILFAIAMRYGNPLPFRGRATEGVRRIPWAVPGGAYLLDETRPKYAQGLFLAASHASPALAILSEPETRATDLAGVETVRLPPGPQSPSVLAATAAEFLHRHPTGVVLANDLAYAVANGGLAATVNGIRRTVAGMPATGRLIASLSCLTSEEREAFDHTGAVRIPAPDPEAAVAAILTKHLGASRDSLGRAALARGKRLEDLTIMDLPPVRDFVLAELADLRVSSDDAAQAGWGRTSLAVAADFEELWRAPPMDRKAARLLVEPTVQEGMQVVRAADLPSVRPEPPGASPRQLGAAVREAFLGVLGPAGEPVYTRVMRSLRKDGASLRPEDLPNVAKLADEALADLEGAIDVADAQRDLLDRARRLQARLKGLARGDR